MGRATELEPGEVFAGRYELQRLLGEGDRKRTYLARDKKMDRLVAISFVKPEAVLEDPEGTEREAKVLGRIGRHDNIVSLYDYDLDADGSVEYMVFEYLSGGTLAEYLRKAGKRSLEEVLRLGRQLCRGLAHLHRRGLMLALDGDLAKAEPKTLRYRVLHAAARLVRSGRRRRLKIAATWPWAPVIATAWGRRRGRSRAAELMLERSVDRDELVAFACSLLPRLRERTVDGSSLGMDALYEIPLMRPNGGTRKGETDAPD